MRDDPEFAEWLAQGPAPLDDCRRRLWWAQRDGQALHAEIASFISTNPSIIEVDRHGKRGKAIFRRLVDPAEEALWCDEFSRVVGSYLDNTRSALNYLAYQVALLAIRENPALDDPELPWKERLHADAVEFPIFISVAKYKENRMKKLPRQVSGTL